MLNHLYILIAFDMKVVPSFQHSKLGEHSKTHVTCALSDGGRQKPIT